MTSVTPPVLITQCPGALIWWLEDDRALCRLVAPKLRDFGWQLVVFHRLLQLRLALQQDEPDVMLLDLRIPGDDVLAALQDWRQEGIECPVLILSGLGDATDRIDGLAAGANDYLVKPFHLTELTWRIEHLLLSSHPRLLRSYATDRAIAVGPLTLEPGRSSLQNLKGDEFRLTRGDLALLMALLSQPNVVHPRNALLRASGSLVDASRSRTLDVRLSRLRRLLHAASAGAVGIASVRGRGYRLTLTAGNSADLETSQAMAIAPLLVGLTRALPTTFHASSAALLLLVLPLGLASMLCWLRGMGGWFTIRGRPAQQSKAEVSPRHQGLLHDLRAPLTRLWVRAEELHADHPPGHDLVAGVLSDLHLMGRLLDALGTRVPRSQRRVAGASTDLHSCCHNLLGSYAPGSVQIDVPHLELAVDPELLSRALHNLIDNAFDHGCPPVSLSAQDQPTGVVLVIEDIGPRSTATPGRKATRHQHPGSGMGVVLEFCRQSQATLEFRPQPAGSLQVRLSLCRSDRPMP